MINRDELAMHIYVALLTKDGVGHDDVDKCCTVCCAAYCAADAFLAEVERQQPQMKQYPADKTYGELTAEQAEFERELAAEQAGTK